MIFGKDLGRSAFFAEVGSEVERLDNIPAITRTSSASGKASASPILWGVSIASTCSSRLPAASPSGCPSPLPALHRPALIQSICAASPPS